MEMPMFASNGFFLPPIKRVYTPFILGRVVDLSETKACHCLAARRRARELTRFYEEKLRPHGLRATQFSVLAVLSLKGPTRLGELADILGLERTSLTRTSTLLEDRKLIVQASSQDARVRTLKITPAGRRKIKAAYPAWKQAQDEIDSA